MSNYLKLYLTSPTGFVNINSYIQKQTLFLVGYRVEFDTSAHSLACRNLQFSIDSFSGNKILTGTTNDSIYPNMDISSIFIPLDNNIVTNVQCNYTIDLVSDLRQAFNYKITGIDMTGFSNLTLIFQYNNDSLV